jgi:hypothetical protein
MKKKFSVSLRRFAFIALLSSMISVIAVPPTAYAAVTDNRGNYGDCGTQMMRAYFANACGTPYTDANGDEGFVMPRRYVSGILRPALYGINTKLELYNYLVGATGLGSGSQQSRVGAAFIIHTMLDRDGNQANANGGKTISAADRNNLYATLVGNTDVSLSIGLYSNRYNSGSRVVAGEIDESFFDNSLGGGTVSNVSSIILRDVSTNVVTYVLEIECANPIGVPRPGLDMPWDTTSSLGVARVDPATGATLAGPFYSDLNAAVVGQRYSFRYNLRNEGPGATTRTITYQGSSMFSPSTVYSGWGGLGSFLAGRPPDSWLIQNGSVALTPIIPASAGGKRYCYRVQSSPAAIDNNGWLLAGPRCVFVPFNYSLTGATSVSSGAIAAGDVPTFSHSMTNSAPGGTTVSDTTRYWIMQVFVPPGGTIDEVNDHDNGPAAGAGVCVAWITGACASSIYTGAAATYNPGTVPITGGPALTAAQTNLAPGSRVCRIVVVERAETTVTNRWGIPRCAVVGKKPYVSIMNGDGWAGGSFSAIAGGSCPVGGTPGGFVGDFTTYSLDGNEYGSYGEYQLFGLGAITSFGSAGRPATASGAPSTNLTYKGPTTLGQFYTSTNPLVASTSSNCLGDAMSYYGSQPSTAYGSPSFIPGNQASGIYRYTGNISIDAGPVLAAGRHVVLIVTGKVTVNGNVAYAPGPYASMADMPSFTLIAAGPAASNNNIEIRQGVTLLEGYYQTYDDFNTCYELPYTGGIALNSNVCQAQLVVNGAVTANKFVLRRIMGADPAPALRNIPGEVFNLRSDLFLSAYGNSQSGRQIRTVSEQELPPRY